MTIVIIHHHLNTGGVTKVIETQAKALMSQGLEFEVWVGDDQNRQPGGKAAVVIPELQYLDKDLDHASREEHLKALENILCERLNPKEHIVHIHNLNLGKNPLLNIVCQRLAANGQRIVNHCHDFAEDQRPANQAHLENVIRDQFQLPLDEVLYPKDTPYQYIVINHKDIEFLQIQGVKADNILELANAIDPPPTVDNAEAKARVLETLKLNDLPIVLYPVRAIDRKNIGELILIASLCEERAHFLITQAPKNPEEVEIYETWKAFCREENIPIIFEAGDACNFEDLMAASDRIITTSMNEGFGMGYLEPWLWGKPVVGRDLEFITCDFKEKGLRLTSFYQELEIDCLDFGLFQRNDQRKFIQAVRKKRDLIPRIIEDFELEKLFQDHSPADIQHNIDLIHQHYSVESYGQKLKHLYDSPL